MVNCGFIVKENSVCSLQAEDQKRGVTLFAENFICFLVGDSFGSEVK